MSAPDRSLLLLPGKRLERLRREVRDVRAAQLRRLLEQCDAYRHQTPPPEHPARSITFFSYAAANLALAYRLTDQRAYLDEARRWILTAVRYPHWGKAHMPDHDLDAGWLCYGLSLAHSWLRGALDEDEHRELGAKLLLQGQRLYDFAVESEGSWWSSSFWQNHNWICHAGLAAAGYALAAEHPEAVEWSRRAEDNFRTVLDLLPDDGSNAEGVVYWRYGVPWIVTYLDLLEQQTGSDLFGDSPYLERTFWFRLYQAAPNLEEIVDHGDCHDRRSGHSVALYYKLASKYRIPQAQWLGEWVSQNVFWREAHESGVKPGVLPEAFLELLWYDPTVRPEGPDDLPTQRYFPDLGLVVARSGWDRDATMVSFKAAPGGGHKAWDTAERLRAERGWETLNAGHHHPDAGSFVLISHDAHLAVDDGYANRKRAANHNLVLVDGQGFVNEDRYHVYKDLDHEHQARICRHAAAHGAVYAQADTARMYPPELGVRRLDRHLWFSPLGHVVVLDELAAAEPRTWTWLLHSDHPAEPLGTGAHLLRKARGRLRVTHLAPECLAFERGVTEVFANPTASSPELAITRHQQTLRAHTGPVAETRFLAVLEPGAAFEREAAELALGGSPQAPAVRRVTPGGEETWRSDGAGGMTVAARLGEEVHLGVVAGSVVEGHGAHLEAGAPVDAFVHRTPDGVRLWARTADDVEVRLAGPPPVRVEGLDPARVGAERGRVVLELPAGTHAVRWVV